MTFVLWIIIKNPFSYCAKELRFGRWAGLDIVNDMTSPKQKQKQQHHRLQKFKNKIPKERDGPKGMGKGKRGIYSVTLGTWGRYLYIFPPVICFLFIRAPKNVLRFCCLAPSIASVAPKLPTTSCDSNRGCTRICNLHSLQYAIAIPLRPERYSPSAVPLT